MTQLTLVQQKQQQIDYLKGLAKIAADSKQYANTSEAALLNLMLSANDLGISPLKALNGGFYIVNGKVCMSTAMMADRIRKEGHSIKITAMTKDKCIITATRKDNGDSLNLEYTMEDASLAGLNNSPTWKKYPKNMLYNRCMSQVARILFPDVVGNSYSEEERFDIQGVSPEKRPLEDADAEMVIETPVVEEKLTEEQMAKLDFMLLDLDDRKAEDFICKRAGISSIYDLSPEKFDGVVTYLEKLLKKKTEEMNDDKRAV